MRDLKKRDDCLFSQIMCLSLHHTDLKMANYIQFHLITSDYIQSNPISSNDIPFILNTFGPITLGCSFPIAWDVAAHAVSIRSKHPMVISNRGYAPFELPGSNGNPGAMMAAAAEAISRKISWGRHRMGLVWDEMTICVPDLCSFS